MLRFSALTLLVCGAVWGAQVGEDGSVIAAKAELARVQGLVAAGALPRASVEKAQDALADAEDAAILRHTAYGDLTVDQADEMLAAARRRLDRRQKTRDDAAKLVDAGAAPKASLHALNSDVEDERREVSLAQSRADLVHELAEAAAVESNYLERLARSSGEAGELTAGYTPDGTLIYANYAKVEVAFRERFGKPMPVSAMGETAVHRAMGFDHRGRVDIALNPDQPEGVWLIDYLKQNHIPFFAFRGPVPGKATGAHIHIGPMSTRLASGG